MNSLIKRNINPIASSYFLFGPRGTGKSTWLLEQYPEALLIDLLDDTLLRKLAANPEALQEILRANPQSKIVIIDEVQKVPELLNGVHRIMEEHKELQFILTGSSSRKLKRSGVDLLAGRAILKKMYPLTASELKDKFDMEEALSYGLIPLVYSSNYKKEVLNTYINLYLREEVQAEGLVRNIGNFARFLEVMSFSHGQLLNLSEIARECQVKRHLAAQYADILEDLLIGYRVYPFQKRAKRILVKSAKFYYFDAGVFNAIRPKGPLDRPEEIGGAALEGLVYHHLRAWMEHSGIDGDIYFWRTKSGNEVDFVVYGEDVFWAIEVKHARSIRKKELNGLKSFREDYAEAKTILLYLGRERLRIDDIWCLPCEDFLKALDLSYRGQDLPV